ncbi:hypothetical protein EZS27_015718 [termite gut metagenome]|uniref:Putative auto-transporter adhesin head GIN domain-containing protein n=1 Tax=termite gut metagenome TaxID=433724 RepID=A0A5J4RSW6_9ZZZZ
MQSCIIIAFGTKTANSSVTIDSKDVIKGNKNIINAEIPVSGYSEISLNVPGEVIYRQLSEKNPSLKIEVDANILPLLEAKVEGNCLKISKKKNVNIQPSRLTIRTNSTNLNKISTSGFANIHLNGKIKSKNMDINISGSSNITSEQLYCDFLNVKVSGLGNLQLNGAGKRTSFSVSGLGNIHAYNYVVEEFNGNISGSGEMYINATKSLNMMVSGSGKIRYTGHPQVSSNISGSGSIKSANE